MLSSVRRLVSSELPRNRRTNLPEGPGALVLTDAQRIEPSMIGHNSQPRSLEDRIAELEAAVSETSDEWEPDGSEDQNQHRPDRIVFKSSERDGQGDRRRTLRLSEIALIETGPANEEAANTSDAEAMPATFRHGADDHDIPAFEVPEDTPEPEIVEDAEAAPVESEEAPPDEQIALSPKELDADAGTEDEAREDIATDEAFEEALAEAVAASLPDAVADEVGQREGGISPERAEELNGRPDTAEIDEASARPLVAALIREELQGELGERITRNVRKLVRQEIQRALTVRELE